MEAAPALGNSEHSKQPMLPSLDLFLPQLEFKKKCFKVSM